MMLRHTDITDSQVISKIRTGEIRYGGNSRLKIFGRLNCRSGKRMKKANRVFFHSYSEAIQECFRPCGHCMYKEYREWLKAL